MLPVNFQLCYLGYNAVILVLLHSLQLCQTTHTPFPVKQSFSGMAKHVLSWSMTGGQVDLKSTSF